MIKNSKLQNMIELSSRLTIYIPSTVNIDEPIDNKKHVDEAAALLSGFSAAQRQPKLPAIGSHRLPGWFVNGLQWYSPIVTKPILKRILMK